MIGTAAGTAPVTETVTATATTKVRATGTFTAAAFATAAARATRECNWRLIGLKMRAVHISLVQLALEGLLPHQIAYLDKLGWRRAKPLRARLTRSN